MLKKRVDNATSALNSHMTDTRTSPVHRVHRRYIVYIARTSGTSPVHRVHRPYIGYIAGTSGTSPVHRVHCWFIGYISCIFCIVQIKQQHKYKTVRIIQVVMIAFSFFSCIYRFCGRLSPHTHTHCTQHTCGLHILTCQGAGLPMPLPTSARRSADRHFHETREPEHRDLTSVPSETALRPFESNRPHSTR